MRISLQRNEIRRMRRPYPEPVGRRGEHLGDGANGSRELRARENESE
jgi:hypothetical protein